MIKDWKEDFGRAPIISMHGINSCLPLKKPRSGRAFLYILPVPDKCFPEAFRGTAISNAIIKLIPMTAAGLVFKSTRVPDRLFRQIYQVL
ncbi:MAG: hypothetical protein EOP52_08950 [Sphingobacteriales bacterium]|nr:MAG: hypothetical protein EOP52_08950 [Sphingobacteriales bacterium]